MNLIWDSVLWSAVPVAVLLIGAAVGSYRLSRKWPLPVESSQARVARAYLAATEQAADTVLPDQPGRSVPPVTAGH